MTAGFSIGVKGGTLKAFAQSASAGPQNSQEVEEDGDIPDDGDVVYIVVAGDTATCNYFGTIWSDTATTSYELPPTMTSLQGSGGSSLTPHVDTLQSAGQTLVINGANLTAAGQSDPPQICVSGVCSAGGAISATGFHLGGSWTVSDTSIAIPYWVDATATAGNYSLEVITAGGAATAAFAVTDATPVITSVNPNSFVVGGPVYVQLAGQHFGTNQPNVTFSLPGSSVTVNSYSDTTINLALNTTQAGAGEFQITAEGYGGKPFQGNPGQPSQTSSPGASASYITTSEVTVVGWINGNAITLPSGANSGLTAALTPKTVSCGTTVGLWAAGVRALISTSTDLTYANNWLLINSSNPDPGPSINPFSLWQSNNYRSFNDYQARFGLRNGNIIGLVNLSPTGTFAGPTPDPCGLVAPVASQTNQYSGSEGAYGGGAGSYQLVEARVGSLGQAVNQTLNGSTVPWVWSVIQFSPSGSFITPMDHAIFPTYSIYVNGQRTLICPQASPPATFIALNQSYQRTPPQIPASTSGETTCQ